jgi:mRNA interferase HicA
VNGAELVRKLRRLARDRGIPFEHDARHGKGSHGTVLFGDKVTTIKGMKQEIGAGLLIAILKQLGLTKNDLP